MKNKNILLILAGIVTTFSIIPYNKMPKIIQDISNILSSLNPIKYLYDMITSMNEIDAIYDLRPGDHIYCHRRFGYTHHGIYAGCGEVWAYQGNSINNATICKIPLVNFANGDKINRLNYRADFDIPTILSRASSRNMENCYNVFNNNCMHYAYWCRLLDQNIIPTEQVINTIIQE